MLNKIIKRPVSKPHTVPSKFLLSTSLEEGTVIMISLDEYTTRHPVVLVQADQPTAVDFDPVKQVCYFYYFISMNIAFFIYINV